MMQLKLFLFTSSVLIALCTARPWTAEEKQAIVEKLKNAAEELRTKIDNAQIEWNDYISKHKTSEKKTPDPRSFAGSLEKFIEGIKELDAQRDAKKEEEKKEKMELIEQVAPFIKQEYDRIAQKIKEKEIAKWDEAQKEWDEMKQLATDVVNIIKTKHEQKKAEKQAAWEKFKENVFGITHGPSSAPAVKPAARSDFLDDVTGTSSYKTWTWILLAICVVIGLILAGFIIYQASRPVSRYERLHGADHSDLPPTEFTPFAPKRSLSEAPVKKLSATRQLPQTDYTPTHQPAASSHLSPPSSPKRDILVPTSTALSKPVSPKGKSNSSWNAPIPEEEQEDAGHFADEKREMAKILAPKEEPLIEERADAENVPNALNAPPPSASIPAPPAAVVTGGYDPAHIQDTPQHGHTKHLPSAEPEDPAKPILDLLNSETEKQLEHEDDHHQPPLHADQHSEQRIPEE